MIRAFLLLGSNEGDRIGFLNDARVRIAIAAGAITKTSLIYQTAAWGNIRQAPFLNQVIEIATVLEPFTLLETLQGIEIAMGRIRKEKWGPRPIDIDILFYDDLSMSTPELTIPHPGIPVRRFTLVPLVEIVPELSHPLLKKTLRELLETCRDILPVNKMMF